MHLTSAAPTAAVEVPLGFLAVTLACICIAFLSMALPQKFKPVLGHVHYTVVFWSGVGLALAALGTTVAVFLLAVQSLSTAG